MGDDVDSQGEMCPDCYGHGYIDDEVCPACGGFGFIKGFQ